LSYCIVIPNYNHTILLDSFIGSLSRFQLPVIMVDDGSDVKSSIYFDTLVTQFNYLTLIKHQTNQGKGGAVQTGLKAAFRLGYSHALQIDADGQHDINDIEKLINVSKQKPLALISGQPIYDASVPIHRYYARNITHFWVWIETLSFHIKDTMCGYRVYPLVSTLKLIDEVPLGKRMDFDIEIMVRLFWRKVEVFFIPTAVDYPEHGISHFKALDDNILISWLHTRLVFGMFIRSPFLLYRNLRSAIKSLFL